MEYFKLFVVKVLNDVREKYGVKSGSWKMIAKDRTPAGVIKSTLRVVIVKTVYNWPEGYGAVANDTRREARETNREEAS